VSAVLPSTLNEFQESFGTTASRFFLQAAARTLLPNERIVVCMRYPVPSQNVKLWYLSAQRRGAYTGLMRCGSVWVCPVCQVAITERRKNELAEAIENTRKKYVTLMVTYTIQHSNRDNLKHLIDTMTQTFRKLRSGGAWQTIKGEYAIMHSVRALEITYGQSGWHPHFHELIFCSSDIVDTRIGADNRPIVSIDDIGQSLERQIGPMWVKLLQKAGRHAIEGRAVNVSTKTGDVAAYINKYGYAPQEKTGWTEAHEITKQPSKRASLGGKTPLELLYDYACGSEKSGHLWLEYARATKGKSQLQWSRGAKQELGIGEISDSEAVNADEHEEHKVLLANIPLDVWKEVYRQERQGQLLIAATNQDLNTIYNVLDSIDPTWDAKDRKPH